MRNSGLLVASFCTGLMVWQALQAQDFDYRVAGVVAASNGRSRAIIERSGADSVLVGEGDEIDGGEVIGIGERDVRLRFGSTDLVLPLSGGPGATEAAADYLSWAQLRGPTSSDQPNMRHVLAAPLLIALDELEESLEDQPGGRAPAAHSDRDSRRELAAHLRTVLNLPADIAISDINGQSFASVTEGVGMIENLVAQGEIVRLQVDGSADAPGEGYAPIYIFPE